MGHFLRMRPRPQGVIALGRAAGLKATLLAVSACNLGGSGASGGFDSQSTGAQGDSGGSGDSGGGGPGGDGVDDTAGGVCEYDPPGGCSVPADCCANVPRLPAVGSEAPGCPGAYPNNWDCQGGSCINLGCSNDADCVLDGFTCETIAEDGLNHCVHSCNNSSDCTAVMPGTACLDKVQGGGKICVQQL